MSYQSEVLSDSPHAYYHLGEASGDVAYDSSGYSRDAKYYPGGTDPWFYPVELGGPSLRTDSTDGSVGFYPEGYVIAPDWGYFNGPFAFECIVRIKDPDAIMVSEGAYFSFNVSQKETWQFHLSNAFDQSRRTITCYANLYQSHSDSKRDFRSTANASVDDYSYPVQRQFHVAVRVYGSSGAWHMEIYLNGELASYEPVGYGELGDHAGVDPRAKPLVIRAGRAYVDEAAFYMHDLSPARIAAHAAQITNQAQGNPRTTPSLIPTNNQKWFAYGEAQQPAIMLGSNPSIKSWTSTGLIDSQAKLSAAISLRKMTSIQGVIDTEAASPQTRTLGQAVESDLTSAVKWLRGTLVDACNDIDRDTPTSSAGAWYGQRYGYDHGPLTLTPGAIRLTYEAWRGAYMFRRIGAIRTTDETYVGIDWRVTRGDPLNEGKWCKIDLASSSGHLFYSDPSYSTVATDPLTGDPLVGWRRSWYLVPAGYISEPGFELRGSNFFDGDQIEITAVVRAQSSNQTRFHPKPLLTRPPDMLSNVDTDIYRTNYARGSDFQWVYASAQDFARKLTVKQVISMPLGKALDTSEAHALTLSADRLVILGRIIESSMANKVYSPPQLLRATSTEIARPLRPSGSLVLGRASETSVSQPLDRVDVVLAVVASMGGAAAYAIAEDQTLTLTVSAAPAEINQAPATLQLTILGGLPVQSTTITFEDQIVAQATTDSDGNLYSLPISVTGVLGEVGTHRLLVTQTGTTAVASGEVLFTVLGAPAPLPEAPAPDASPTPVDAGTGTGRKWVFQDPSPGGIGSYVLPINPREMSSPHLEHAFTSRHSTAHSGRFHVFQAAMTPKEWQFSGYCPTEEMAEKLLQYRELNRRIYIIDHHGRAWKVVVTHLEIVPRLRHFYNGELSDWGSDWTMTVTVVDQEPTLVP